MDFIERSPFKYVRSNFQITSPSDLSAILGSIYRVLVSLSFAVKLGKCMEKPTFTGYTMG